MTFDNEQQKSMVLQLIDQAPLNGSYSGLLQTVQVLAQFRQEVINATVGVPNAATTGCNCTEGKSV